MGKEKDYDIKDFEEKINCIVRNIEDNIYFGKIKTGTISSVAELFIDQYKLLREVKKEWKLKKVKYMPMQKGVKKQ